MGVGGEEMKQLLTMLDLLHQKLFEKNSIKVVEDDVGTVLHVELKVSMNRAAQETVKLTLEENNND
eukprot:10764123-Ditylum_brightwellii.AAC.1